MSIREQTYFELKLRISDMRIRRLRTMREFAEQEIILPTGRRRGLRFRCDFMPWTGLILDEFDRGRYRRFFGSGSVQSGKTLLFFIIPTLYHLFERGEPVIVGVPKLEMGQSIYHERLIPVIRQNPRMVAMLPRAGSGSRGGKFESVTFRNGAVLRFMGAGGGDEQRSSHTAPVVVLTEIDKMDEAGQASREADPVTQIESRADSYGDQARIYAECTMSTEQGRVYQEVVAYGTDTRIAIQCAHCEDWFVPAREHLVGWHDAHDVMEARENARLVCPHCGVMLTDTDRLKALERPLAVSKGQEIKRIMGETPKPQGEIMGETPMPRVVGEIPPTNTFGFRWTAIHSSMRTLADSAEKEYRAMQSDRIADMKAVMQFVWGEAYQEQLQDMSGISRDLVLSKIGTHSKGIIPQNIQRVTCFIDLGLYRCWWVAWAWRQMPEGFLGYLLDYGSRDVPQGRETNPLSILGTLRSFREEVLEAGWPNVDDPDGERRRCDLTFVDSGYEKDIAYEFVKESGQARYRASKGFGTAPNQSGWHELKTGKDRLIGREWQVILQANGIKLVGMHSDFWKRQVHLGFSAAIGAPGSLALYQAAERDHWQFARQITAEREEEEFVEGKGRHRFWNRRRPDNHWFDCTYGCMVAASMAGVDMFERALPKRVKTRPSGKPAVRHPMRTRY